MKFELNFDIGGVGRVYQIVDIEESANMTKEEVIVGLNNGTIVTGLTCGEVYLIRDKDDMPTFNKIGTVETIDIEHDLEYSDFCVSE